MRRRIEVFHTIYFAGNEDIPYVYTSTLGERGDNDILTAISGGDASSIPGRAAGELSWAISIEVFPSWKAPDEPLYNKQVRRSLHNV